MPILLERGKGAAVLLGFAIAALCVHACGGSSESGLFGESGRGGAGATAGSGPGATGGSLGVGGAPSTGGAGGTFGVGGNTSTGGTGGDPDGASGAAGDSDGAAGASGAGDGSAGSGQNGSVDCGGMPCAITQGAACCRSLTTGVGGAPFGGFGGSGFGGSGGGGSSVCNMSGTCSMGSTRIRCDGTEDCAAGSACCASFTATAFGTFYSELSCRLVADCAGAGRRIVCEPGATDACPNGGSCQTATGLPAGYEVCR